MASPRKELLGYTDPLVAHPGDIVEIKVTAEDAEYEATIVRLIHGDVNPDGPGFKVEEIDTPANGTYPGRHQETYIGSYVDAGVAPGLDVESYTIQTWIRPTTPALGRVQAIAGAWDGARGLGLVIEGDGRLTLRTGGPDGTGSLACDAPLIAGQWYFVAATYDAATGAATVTQRIAAGWDNPAAAATASGTLPAPDASGLRFLIGAGYLEDRPVPAPRECYNGKLENPRVYGRALAAGEIETLASGADPTSIGELAAAWDFAATPASSSIVADVGPNAIGGSVVNYPMRGLTGHNWDATAFSRDDAPGQYGAIHFHDDDFEDSRWETDFVFEVPDDLRSGFYAARLVTDDEEDYVPFFVTPRPGEANAPVAFLVPTNTYLAYANERLITAGEGLDFSGLTNIPIVVHDYDLYLGERREMGGSIYDIHTDGSGVAYSSYLRPIVSMRPTHRHWVTGGPRHLPSDLYTVDWLEEKGFDYEVITDEDLHFQGKELLDRFKVVVTGSHPEYWTTPMMDALEDYLAGSGRLMYLGGNGFYWVTAFDPERPHVVEVRRGFAGSRAWESHPGELELASTGETGGLWRHVGRSPNAIVGIGFSAQGWDLNTPGYRRTEQSHDPRAAFIFEGIGDDEEIGEFGLIMNGAAGDELDRADAGLGTPSHALVVATSAGLHSDYYLICHEDIPVTMAEIHGTDNPNVRADVVYFETGDGGAVFSTGSINWSCSLSHNGYDNNVSRMTENVLREFLAR